jgi:hypothetical protein
MCLPGVYSDNFYFYEDTFLTLNSHYVHIRIFPVSWCSMQLTRQDKTRQDKTRQLFTEGINSTLPCCKICYLHVMRLTYASKSNTNKVGHWKIMQSFILILTALGGARKVISVKFRHNDLLTAQIAKMTACWDMTPCSLVDKYRLKGMCCHQFHSLSRTQHVLPKRPSVSTTLHGVTVLASTDTSHRPFRHIQRVVICFKYRSFTSASQYCELTCLDL